MPKSVFKPPPRMKFKSDGNIIEFQTLSEKKKSKEILYVYKYTVSTNKIGTELPMTEDQINKLLNGNIAEKIN